jgi:hypothetical protein
VNEKWTETIKEIERAFLIKVKKCYGNWDMYARECDQCPHEGECANHTLSFKTNYGEKYGEKLFIDAIFEVLT